MSFLVNPLILKTVLAADAQVSFSSPTSELVYIFAIPKDSPNNSTPEGRYLFTATPHRGVDR